MLNDAVKDGSAWSIIIRGGEGATKQTGRGGGERGK